MNGTAGDQAGVVSVPKSLFRRGNVASASMRFGPGIANGVVPEVALCLELADGFRGSGHTLEYCTECDSH
jgi:hypothetical protein